jgi:hypothetical protein
VESFVGISKASWAIDREAVLFGGKVVATAGWRSAWVKRA